MKTLQTFDRSPPRRPTFKPLLEDALQVLKGPLHNPEAKDFRKIVSVLKNCWFFRENFSSQVALSEFVELAKFYVGYEVHPYGDVLLHDKEYADKLCVILDGTVEKISQKPYGEIEEQIKDKRRGLSLVGFERNLFKSKTQLPSIVLPSSPKRISTPKANSVSIKFLKLQRLPSQERESSMATLEDNEGPDFEDLMKFIVRKTPEMKKRYYAEEILRADRVKTLKTGDYFGESFCVSNHPKSNHMYAVSSPEAHLLTLSKEDYCEIMRQLESRNYKKLEAFIKLFPSFEKDYVAKFSQHFSQKNFQVDEVIYFQDAPAQDLYIVQSGGVQFLRKSEFREGFGSSLIPIVSVGKDQAFGEEFLLLMDSRQESAVANASNTIVFVLKAALISELEEEFDALFVELKKRAEEKFQWRQKKAKEFYENSEDSPRSPSLSPPKSQVLTLSDLPVSSFKDIHGLYSPRHSIQIPYRRSFRSEKSLTYSVSSTNSGNSTFSTMNVRRLSDGQLPQQAKKTEIYKSRFGRTSILSDTPRAVRKTSNFQADNLSPISDLKTMNFRKELYGKGNSSVRSLGRFEKAALNSHSSQDPKQRVQRILNIHTNHQSPFQTLVIKRVQI